MSFEPTPAPAPTRPGWPARTITVTEMIADLEAAQIIDQQMLVSLLGSQRVHSSVNVLELALIRRNIMAPEDLLARKAALWGLPAYPDHKTTVRPLLPQQTAAHTGALVLDRSIPTVAMVEPNEDNLAKVAAAVGTDRFEVWVTTTTQFADLLNAAYAGSRSQELPATPDLYTLLDQTVAADASDLHLKVGVSPRMRIDGAIKPLAYRPVDRLWLRRAVELIAPERNQEEIARKFSTDFAYSFGNARFRVNAARDQDGATMVLRRLPTALPTAEDLNLPTAIRNFAGLERGLVLVTGPTGSGKSTTLAAVLNSIITTSARHVITLEDPVEFTLPTDGASLVNQRELGSSFASFPDGIRDALRQDPDVMLVGEMRDQETTRAALELADTGHLVFATLHTSSAPATVQRVIGLFPADEQDHVRVQLAQLLKGCVSQTLLPRASGRGRVAAFEILLHNPAVATNMRKVDGANQLKQTMQMAAKSGMVTMETSLAKLAHDGVVTRDEARFRAQNQEDFDRQLTYFDGQA